MRDFKVSFSEGKFWLHYDGWGCVDPLTPDQLTEKLQEWEDSCYQESIAKVWICQACGPGGKACAKICNTEPDRCIYESGYSEEELKELQDEGHRAPVDWTEGKVSKLPITFLHKLRRNGKNAFADRTWCELNTAEAKRCLDVDV